jgi:hypothetical protein
MTQDIDRLGPKDFLTGCLAIVVAVIVVPILVLLFKVSIYLALVIGIMIAIVLGTALLGKVVRLIFFRRRPDDKDQSG